MERLAKTLPVVKLTEQQKKDLAELDSLYAAKIAERQLFLDSERAKAIDKGDEEALRQIEQQMVSSRKSLQAELEEKKDVLRQQKA